MTLTKPYIIYGTVKLDGALQNNVDVKVRNDTTTKEHTVQTNSLGQYNVTITATDWYAGGASDGDIILVTWAGRTKQATVDDSTWGSQVNFDLYEQTKEFTADACLLKRLSKSFTTDALLQAKPEKGFTTDAHLLKRAVKTFTSDAILEAIGVKGLTTDALLLKRGIKSFTVDALLEGALSKGLTVDAHLLKRAIKTFTSDAILETIGIKGLSTDALLLKRLTKSFTSDAILEHATTNVGLTVDAWLTTPTIPPPSALRGGIIPRKVPSCLIVTLDGHLLLNINVNKPQYIELKT